MNKKKPNLRLLRREQERKEKAEKNRQERKQKEVKLTKDEMARLKDINEEASKLYSQMGSLQIDYESKKFGIKQGINKNVKRLEAFNTEMQKKYSFKELLDLDKNTGKITVI